MSYVWKTKIISDLNNIAFINLSPIFSKNGNGKNDNPRKPATTNWEKHKR